jgi:xylulokinase
LGLDAQRLPSLYAPGEVIGNLSADVATALGLPQSVLVIAGAGDGQAAALGAGISGERAYLNLGTALVSGVESAEYRRDRAYRTLYSASRGAYLLETDLKGGTFTLGWLIEKWLKQRGVSDAEILKQLESKAAVLARGADGLMVVPYWNGVMNPYWDDDATGIVVGFRGEHGPEHLYRAILEGLAFEQRLHSRAVEASLGAEISEFVIMGGGAKSQLFCQILADVLNRKLVLSSTLEATALGAGMLAAVGAGMYASTRDATGKMASTREMFVPGPASGFYETLYERVYKSLYPALQSSLLSLTELREAAT